MADDIKTELSERAVRYLDYLEESIKSGGDFISEQAPEVVRELILYHRVENTFFVILAMFIGIIAWVVFMKKVVPEFDKEDENEAILILGTVGFFAAEVGSSMVFFFHISDFLKVWLAPRVFILEEIARLMK